jgi:hypothetical protein
LRSLAIEVTNVRWLRRLSAVVLVVGACHAPPAAACPICKSETGEQVRAGIFGADFGWNLLVTLLPFPIFLGIAMAFHLGFHPREEEEAADAMPSPSSQGAD